MVKNYFIISIRNLLKRKGYAALNVLGLTIGITCCLLIFQYVSRERSFDTFQKNAAQIVRVRLDQYKQGKLLWQSATSYPAFGPLMKKDYPEVEKYCRLIDDETLLTNQATNARFVEKKGYYADPSSIGMLGVQLYRGNASAALSAPDKMIVSQSMARKYFGTDDVVGKSLTALTSHFGSGRTVFQVSGVFKDYPLNSHLIIDYLVSYSTLVHELTAAGDKSDAANTAIGWYDFYVYLQLKPGINIKQLQAKMPDFADKYVNSRRSVKADNIKDKIYLIPLRDIHLYSNYNQEAEINGNGKAVDFMFLIALIILGIAWINYINLSTARSVERAKEVGVRKVLGAGKQTLITQFMLENLLLNLAAIMIAGLAVYILTPGFNSLMGEPVKGFQMPGKYWLLFSGIFMCGTLLSGIYPAFVLSGYQPVAVLKGAFKNTSGGLLLRKGLIILQFSISVVLIAGTIIIYQQVRFMRNQQLGVNISQTLVLDGAQSVIDSLYKGALLSFKAEALKNPGVKGITASSSVMGREIYWTNSYRSLAHTELGAATLYRLGIDHDFIPQFELKVLAGRNFSKDFTTDRNAAILNERAVTLMGFKDANDAIGKKIAARDTLTIVGVVQSFHQLGLQKPIDPQLMTLQSDAREAYSLKLQSKDLQATIAGIKVLWTKYFPNDPFNYYFLDDDFNTQYQNDQRFGQMFSLFSFLAILIACFGLVGLSAYNILQRTKEIGVRKVLGASVKNVVFILSKDFLLLVILAFIVAAPVAGLVMHSWLQGFAYRVAISWWVFGVAGLLALVIALGTLSFQAVKAALVNPVRSLRSE